MITIDEIRNKFPQYNQLADKELADKLYNKFYKDKLDINDFYSRIGLNAADELISKAQNQGVENTGRNIQPYEEFTNPTQYPGFNNLPQNEKLNRLSLSQFDPANQSPLGTFVPPGTYEQPTSRVTGELLTNALLPEARFGEFGKSILNPFANILSRTGLNTGLTQANPENENNLANNFKDNLKINSLLEMGILPFKALREFAELGNPMKFTNQQLKNIKNKYESVRDLEKKYYAPSNKYNADIITKSPESFLGFKGENTWKWLTPDVKKLHASFVKDPTFKNLKDLQDKINLDWGKVANNPNKLNQAQALNSVRLSTRDKIKKYLAKDPEVLANYNKGLDVSHKQKHPFESTKTLTKIAKGKIKDIKPEQLHAGIKEGLEQLNNEIPEGHYLQTVYNSLSDKIGRGEGIPQWYTKLAQNPWINKMLSRINPLYKAIGGTAGSELATQKENAFRNIF